MKRFRLLILSAVFVIVALLVADFFGRDLAMREGVLAGSEYLSIYELYQLKKQAKAGNIKAAKRLASYYGIWKNDTEEMMYWTSISAELGDPVDQYNYGMYLIKKKHNKAGGEVWIEKSAADGYQRAKDYLRNEPGSE